MELVKVVTGVTLNVTDVAVITTVLENTSEYRLKKMGLNEAQIVSLYGGFGAAMGRPLHCTPDKRKSTDEVIDV